MYIIIAGGGKVGYYLAKELLEDGHEILVIEKDAKTALQIGTELGDGSVMRGMADEAATMERAGANRADLIIAVTGDDEDNLVISQVARLKFNVPRVIARVNNPKNEELFRRLGINITVSSTRFILSLIEQELPSKVFIPLVNLRTVGMEFIELHVLPDSQLVGKRLGDVTLPPGSTFSLIVRAQKPLIPTADTVVEVDDRLFGFTPVAQESDFKRVVS